MPGFFICYRRDDAADITGRLYDRLSAAFGKRHVFKDVFSIDLGHDFDVVIEDSIERTSVLLALMGDRWDLERLKSPNDPVRKEIEQALSAGVRVVPLFVRGARMPAPDALPESMRLFANLNGMPLRDDPDFDHDVDRLIRSLMPPWLSRGRRVRRLIAVGVAVVAFAVTLVAMSTRREVPRVGFRMSPVDYAVVARRQKSMRAAFCAVDASGAIHRCNFATQEACAFASGRSSPKLECVPRPAEVTCAGGGLVGLSAPPEQADGPCYARRQDRRAADCTPLMLPPVEVSASPSTPITQDEVEAIRREEHGSFCRFRESDGALLGCRWTSKGACVQESSTSPEQSVCKPRPDALHCASTPFVDGASRIVACYGTAQACRAQAMPGTKCTVLRLGNGAPRHVVGKAKSAPVKESSDTSEEMPSHDGQDWSGPFCIHVPGGKSWREPMEYSELRDICFEAMADCRGGAIELDDDGVCDEVERFWCFLEIIDVAGILTSGIDGKESAFEYANVYPRLCSIQRQKCEQLRLGYRPFRDENERSRATTTGRVSRSCYYFETG